MGQYRSNNSTDIKHFEVDGVWGKAEAKAAWLFAKVVNYNTQQISTVANAGDVKKLVLANRSGGAQNFNASEYETQLSSASQSFIVGTYTVNGVDVGNSVKSWMNAWNAPHWIKVTEVIGSRTNNFLNSQDKSQIRWRENFGSSCMADLLIAQQWSPNGLHSTNPMVFSGATDENHAFTPGSHASLDLGMAFDIALTTRIGQPGFDVY